MTSDIREFVTNCYREILIREPDIDGLKYYVGKIQNGEISLEQFPTIMRESKEYKDELENNEKNLEKRKNQQAGNMSGGEQQMLAISRALMLKPKLLLLDEPSLGLSPILVQDIFDTIKELHKAGTTVLFV